MKKVIVTGGAGFIGSHLVERLVRDNFEVCVIDNLTSGKLTNLSRVKNKIDFHQIDIRSSGIESLFKDADAVFHLAALADIVPSITSPREYMDVNIMGTVQVLEAARVNEVRRIVYAASSSCYGLSEEHPTSVHAKIDTKYPYALSKFQGEQIFRHWQRIYKMQGISLRLFNVYGPRARTSGNYGAVLGVFLGQKKAGIPLTIVGDGTQRRDFIFIDDVVEAFIAAYQSNLTEKIYNIGASKPIAINYLAKLVGGETINIPKRPGEPDITYADISETIKDLSWSPRISIEAGIKEVLRDALSWKDAPVWSVDKIEEQTRDWFKYLDE